MNYQTRNRHRTRTTYHAGGDLSVDSENDVSAAHGITDRRRTRKQKGRGRIGEVGQVLNPPLRTLHIPANIAFATDDGRCRCACGAGMPGCGCRLWIDSSSSFTKTGATPAIGVGPDPYCLQQMLSRPERSLSAVAYSQLGENHA